MRTLLFMFIFCAWLPGVAFAQTTIHKCKNADGGVVYSQLPCKDEAPVETERPEPDKAVEILVPVSEQPESLPLEEVAEDVATSESSATCKKRYRDQIDAIDAEIQREYSKEKDGDYKQRLLSLTRKLREC